MAPGVARNRDERIHFQAQRALRLRAKSGSDVRDNHHTTPGGDPPPAIRRDPMCAPCTLQAEPAKDVPTSSYFGSQTNPSLFDQSLTNEGYYLTIELFAITALSRRSRRSRAHLRKLITCCRVAPSNSAIATSSSGSWFHNFRKSPNGNSIAFAICSIVAVRVIGRR